MVAQQAMLPIGAYPDCTWVKCLVLINAAAAYQGDLWERGSKINGMDGDAVAKAAVRSRRRGKYLA